MEAIEDLIKRYKKELEKYDFQINSTTETIRNLRKENNPSPLYFDDVNEALDYRQEQSKLRQQLFQVIKDLEDYV